MKVLDSVEVMVKLKEKIEIAKRNSDNSLVERLEKLLTEVLNDPRKKFL